MSPYDVQMLYIFAGLPGVGKSTLAQMLARRLRAVYVRIDAIEDALAGAGAAHSGLEGYVVAYRVAGDNLKLGHTVVADCVNPVAATRNAWRAIASEAAVACVELEIVCSDPREHQSRLESRGGALRLSDVLQHRYDAWDSPRIGLDTAGQTTDESYASLVTLLALEDCMRRKATR